MYRQLGRNENVNTNILVKIYNALECDICDILELTESEKEVIMNNSLAKRMKDEGYKFVSIDLFSGPGGLCTGFKWAGILPLIAVECTDTKVETYSVSHNAEIL